MKPKDVFTLAVRLLGLVFLYHGLRDVPAALGQIAGSFPHRIGPDMTQHGNLGGFVIGVAMVAWPLLVAYWLLRGAPLVVRIAYPQSSAGTTDAKPTGGVLGHNVNA